MPNVMPRIGILVVALLLAACGGGGPGSGFVGTYPFTLDCAGVVAYDPGVAKSPYTAAAVGGGATTTLIVMHGKTGSPSAPHLQSFYTAMTANGYNVVAPYMPWSGTDWDGSLCAAMAYLDQLAEAEIAGGRNVVVVGHSMGGVHALIYGATQPPAGVKAIVPIAPGHMPQIGTGLANATAADVARAKGLVASGDGDVPAYFITLNSGQTQYLFTTPNIYLSYHDLVLFPDIRGVLPKLTLPVLWFAGSGDSLTTTYDMASLAKRITSANSEYQVISGDHLGVVANTPAPLTTWLSALGI